MTLINEENTYAHNDPNGAYPTNAFVEALVPFLKGALNPRSGHGRLPGGGRP